MKKHLKWLPILFVIVMSGCFSIRELPVEYDYSFKGRFDKYNSYDFINLQGDISVKGEKGILIRDAIEKHMQFLGYRQNYKKPDLLLSYWIFYDSLSFRGYDQPEIEEWMEDKKEDIEYRGVKIKMPKGTLIMQVYDRKQDASIWQGYATDRYGGIDFNDFREVRNAVRSILNKYQFFAEGFIEEQIKKSTQ